jgi:hypothetical protein
MSDSVSRRAVVIEGLLSESNESLAARERACFETFKTLQIRRLLYIARPKVDLIYCPWLVR